MNQSSQTDLHWSGMILFPHCWIKWDWNNPIGHKGLYFGMSRNFKWSFVTCGHWRSSQLLQWTRQWPFTDNVTSAVCFVPTLQSFRLTFTSRGMRERWDEKKGVRWQRWEGGAAKEEVHELIWNDDDGWAEETDGEKQRTRVWVIGELIERKTFGCEMFRPEVGKLFGRWGHNGF